MLRPEEVDFFMRLHSPWEGEVHLPRPQTFLRHRESPAHRTALERYQGMDPR